jgi:hypothetical protein
MPAHKISSPFLLRAAMRTGDGKAPDKNVVKKSPMIYSLRKKDESRLVLSVKQRVIPVKNNMENSRRQTS